MAAISDDEISLCTQQPQDQKITLTDFSQVFTMPWEDVCDSPSGQKQPVSQASTGTRVAETSATPRSDALSSPKQRVSQDSTKARIAEETPKSDSISCPDQPAGSITGSPSSPKQPATPRSDTLSCLKQCATPRSDSTTCLGQPGTLDMLDCSEEMATKESAISSQNEGHSHVAVTIYDDGLSQFSRSLMKGEDSVGTSGIDTDLHEEPYQLSSEDDIDDYQRPKRVKCLNKQEIVIEGLCTGKDAPLEVAERGVAGRGVFATGPIAKGQWLCEYKGMVYPRREMKRHIGEYDNNGEGCYIITSKYPVGDGMRLCWDATRYMHQYGRYLNHARQPNSALTSPVYCRGKWRIGFLAVRDIAVGDEVVWDYGVTTEEWGKCRLLDGVVVRESDCGVFVPTEPSTKEGKITESDSDSDVAVDRRRRVIPILSDDDQSSCSSEPKERKSQKVKKRTETLSPVPHRDTRRYHFCPFKGCRRAVKKLSQHLQYKHPNISPKKRRSLCAKAQVAKGKGHLKPLPVHPWQPTLSHVMENNVRDEDGDKRRACTAGSYRVQGEEEDIRQTRDDDELQTRDRVQGEEEDASKEDLQTSDNDELQTDLQTRDDDEPQAQEKCGGDLLTGGPDDTSKEEVITFERELEILLSSTDEDVSEVGGQFPPDHPFFIHLRQYLTSRHGRARSERETRQIVSEVSRFLQFAGPVLNPTHLYDPKKLDSYLTTLDGQGKAPTTQHAALCRIQQGMKYVHLSLDPAETVKADKALRLVSNWLSTLGKEARKDKRRRLEQLSEQGSSSLTEIEHFARCETMMNLMKTVVGKLRRGERVTQADLRQLMVWLAGCLMHCNAQRPGAVTNATVDEYDRATSSCVGRETYQTISVANHKTATTGTAKLSMDRHLTQQMHLYATQIRPSLEGCDSTLLFPNREGKQLDHLSRHVTRLAGKVGIKLPQTATATRHAAATAAVERGEVERAHVAVAMSHSAKTQELYYTLTKGKKEAVKGYRVMEGIRRVGKEGHEGCQGTGKFSVDDTRCISEFFADHVSGRQPPTIDECREFIRQHPIERTAKQIRDKVRNMIGRNK